MVKTKELCGVMEGEIRALLESLKRNALGFTGTVRSA